MDLAAVESIADELAGSVPGSRVGKLFQLSRNELAIDLRLADSLYLFISVEPGSPRLYLIRRRLKDLEKASINPSPFLLQLRKQLSGATLRTVAKTQGERLITIAFDAENELGEPRVLCLAAQLTGRSANLFLVDARGLILDSLRQTNGDGQEIGMAYAPPLRPPGEYRSGTLLSKGKFKTFSEALDDEDLRKKEELRLRGIAVAARNKFKKEVGKREKLLAGLAEDLARHGDPERWKRCGDLLLANIATATRTGDRVHLTDYFDAAQPTIEIEVDENDSLSASAEKFFRKYTKARNAREEIKKRIETVSADLENLKGRREDLEQSIASGDADAIAEFAGTRTKTAPEKRKRKEPPVSAHARIFTSSDGIEILVGKKAKDNDHLTFRIAKSLDTWMHAADYPGSHVVIRSRDRKEIPPATLLEAAQLAAFYSQGKTQPKAAVHYTQKKFVNKPKGAAPGLVSLANFKTILVEPAFPASVQKRNDNS